MPKCSEYTGSFVHALWDDSIYCLAESSSGDNIVYVYNAPYNDTCAKIFKLDCVPERFNLVYTCAHVKKVSNDCAYFVFIFHLREAHRPHIILYKNNTIIGIIEIHEPSVIIHVHDLVVGYGISNGEIREYYMENDTIKSRRYVSDFIRFVNGVSCVEIRRTKKCLYYMSDTGKILMITNLHDNPEYIIVDSEIEDHLRAKFYKSYLDDAVGFVSNYLNDTYHIIGALHLEDGRIEQHICTCDNVGDKGHLLCRIGKYYIYERRNKERTHITFINNEACQVIGLFDRYYVKQLGVMFEETADNFILRGLKWNWKLFTKQPKAAQSRALLAIWALKNQNLPRDLARLIAEMCLMPF